MHAASYGVECYPLGVVCCLLCLLYPLLYLVLSLVLCTAMSSLVLMLCNAGVYAVVSTYSLIPSTYVIPATLYAVVYALMYAMLCTCSLPAMY